MLATLAPLAVARLKPPEAPSVTVKPLMMLLVSRAEAGTPMRIWLAALPRTWPPPATRLAVAPAVRPTRAALRVTDEPAPVPAVLWTVEWPALKRTVPRLTDEATPLPPRTFRVPPLRTTVAEEFSRPVLLSAVLSRVRVAPALTVSPGPPVVTVETEPSATFADAVRPEVLIVMTGWGSPASGPWNVTRK